MLFMNWSLVDDGVIVLRAKEISGFVLSLDFKGLLKLFIEKDIGRFRPIYYLSYWVVYLIGRVGVLFYYLFHFLNFSLIIFTIYKIGSLLFEGKVGFWAALLFLISWINTENWYRLGPQETLMVFYFLLSFYFFLLVFLKKSLSGRDRFLAYLFIAFAFLAKETSVAFLVPLFSLYFSLLILKGQDKSISQKFNLAFLKRFLSFSFLLGAVILIIATSLRFEGAYTSNYVLNPKIVIQSGKSYLRVLGGSFFPVFPLVFFIFSLFLLTSLLKSLKKRKILIKDLWSMFFLVWFFSFLLIQTPWVFGLSRYLMPTLAGLVIFMAVGLVEIEKRLKNLWARRVLIFGLFLFLLFQNFYLTLSTITTSIIGTNNSENFLVHVAQTAPKNSTVYFNLVKGDATLELVVESELHLNLLLERPDLKVEYLGESKPLPGSLIVSAFVSDNFLLYPEDYLQEELGFKDKQIYQYTFIEISDISVTGLRNYLFYRGDSPFFAEMIRARQVSWVIYQNGKS